MHHHIAYNMQLDSLDIVVVEDNESMRRILYTMLSAFGVAKIRTFIEGHEALEAMQVDPPDLVITDWQMQPGNGYDLVRFMRLSQMMPLSLVPVMMVTGFASRYFVEKSFEAGVHQFLVKPISPSSLLSRIEWLLRDSRMMVEEDGCYHIEGMGNLLNGVGKRRDALAKMKHMLAKSATESAAKPDPTPASLPQKPADIWNL